MAERSESRATVAVAESVAGLAYRMLLDHLKVCGRCAANWRECPTRRALSAELRVARR